MPLLPTFFFLGVLLVTTACQSCGINLPTRFKAQPAEAKGDTSGLPVSLLMTDPGFSIAVWASGIPDARGLSVAPDGTIFTGSRSDGRVWALRDTDGDGQADRRWLLAEDISMPAGVAWHNGDLYVSAVSRILRLPDILRHLDDPPDPVTVYADFPTDKHHGWKYIAFGPDGKLYVPVGAPCNNCLRDDPVYASITRMNPDGTGMEIVHRGIRNTVGFAWHPGTGELWFTDNGRDWLGDDLPACELNRASADHLHFGYPYCHQGDLPDPEFGHLKPCDSFTPPVRRLGAHVAPLGMAFVRGPMFPDSMRHHILVAEHGSWNRTVPVGYRVMRVDPLSEGGPSYVPFVTGWLQGDRCWGRPVDLEMLPDGSFLLSDDYAGCLYRITYTPLP
ncbi:MAG: sorbosone dehydrogenase family protein [Saprospiraceae bacterium]|nr:sorbosone dehydrogenase family protein [Saprospiraceae bacterium]